MSAAPSPALRKLFSEMEQLFQTETETRAAAMLRAGQRTLAEHLNQSVRRLRQAVGFDEITAVLCDASTPFCNGCAVFHVSENGIRGARLRGADGAATLRFQEVQFPIADGAAFAGVIDSREPVVTLCSQAEVTPGLIRIFEHTADDKASLFPLTSGSAVAGVLYATGVVERAALELLAQSASAVLENRQRPARPVPTDLVSIAGATPSGKAGLSWEALSPADRNLHLRAQRFARVHVAEIRLYQADAVKQGRASRDLYAALQDVIDNTRADFKRQFLSETPTMVDYFHRELLHTMANDDPAALGENYPGPLV